MPSVTENVIANVPAWAAFVLGVTLKNLLLLKVLAASAEYVPPEVALFVTVAVEPNDPVVT